MSALEYLINLNRCLFRFKALLDHIRWKLELTVSHEVAGYEVQDFIVSGLVVQLEHVLDQIVAERVLNEQEEPLYDLIGESQLLSSEALLQTALHNAATMFIGSNCVTVGNASIEDELGVSCQLVWALCIHLVWSLWCPECHQECLQYVVPIRICRQLENLLLESLSNFQDFFIACCLLLSNNID